MLDDLCSEGNILRKAVKNASNLKAKATAKSNLNTLCDAQIFESADNFLLTQTICQYEQDHSVFLFSFNSDLSRTRPQENRLDENFSIVDYVQKARVSYKLKKRKTKNAEEILQQMFEDELNADDLGPDLKDFDELNDAIEHESDTKSRALTLKTVDADL